jgi:SAM-dependent methyltransferase
MIAQRRLDRLTRAAWTVISDPVEGVERVREKVANEGERWAAKPSKTFDPRWEESLHTMLDVGWPCEAAAEFEPLWGEAVSSVRDSGIEVGRGSYSGWDDGDAGLARAAWCLTRHTRPITVVETGVARGFTTRMILEALEANRDGQLFSIDLAPPLSAERVANETGAAVVDRLRRRWTLIEGSSRRRLPGLLEHLGMIDLFVHDSRHTRRNISFELRLAWRALRPGGFLLADDIGANLGFTDVASESGGAPTIICSSDDGRGRFGLIRKPDEIVRARHQGR